jgi:YXWGXW repeat-containing protein
MRKKVWISAAGALACTGALMSAPAAAYTSVGVQIGVPAPVYVAPPPPPVYEYTPGPRRGHVWVPGHWQWRGNSHVWVQGHFLRERPGYYYNQPRWVQHGDRWDYRGGGWSRRDRDHDGIPNRYDRDRDGDGVPNRRDRAPNNPYYR